MRRERYLRSEEQYQKDKHEEVIAGAAGYAIGAYILQRFSSAGDIIHL